MGSSMLAEDLGYEIMHEIMNAFRELNDFSIICKCNEKFIRKSSRPQNVLFVEWMQQNEILGMSSFEEFSDRHQLKSQTQKKTFFQEIQNFILSLLRVEC